MASSTSSTSAPGGMGRATRSERRPSRAGVSRTCRPRRARRRVMPTASCRRKPACEPAPSAPLFETRFAGRPTSLGLLAVVIVGGSLDHGEVASGSFAVAAELGGEDREPPDAVLAFPERVAGAPRRDDRRAVPVYLGSLHPGEVALEPREP